VLCCICQSPGNRQANCQLRGGGQGKPTAIGRGVAHNYACNIDTGAHTSSVSYGQGVKNQTSALSGREIDRSLVVSASRTNFCSVEGDTQNIDCKKLGSQDGVTDTRVKRRADAGKRGGPVARVDNIDVGLQPAYLQLGGRL